ncbi:MAG TPA: hypothetical protein DCM62_06175 [Bacteroidales bacterium]|nr:hypothetical protein [Bacteroidales bacterium]
MTILPKIPQRTPSAFRLPFRRLIEPLLVLFNFATQKIFSGKEYFIDYSIPGGLYGHYKDFEPSDEDLNKLQDYIRQMLKSKIKLQQQVAFGEQVKNYFQQYYRDDILHLLRSRPSGIDPIEAYCIAHVNGDGELFVNGIEENLEALQAFKLIKAKGGFFLISDADFFDRVMPRRIESSKYFKRFVESHEAMAHFGISNIAQLNDVITQGDLPEFLKISEAYQTKNFSRIADNIIAHPLKPRVIFLAGPTSSGKTTSASRLALELKVLKKNVLTISLDNYYKPHSEIPDDPETGLKNFEVVSSLNVDQFKSNINDLLAGKPVVLPRYHFNGLGGVSNGDPTEITPDTYIIAEGIHALNPLLWGEVQDGNSYRLYVSALTTLNIHDHLPFSTSDHRLIRRLVRDHLFRGYGFNETIKRWPDVVKNEFLNIFPFQETAHAIINSALIYEMAVFAHYAPAILDPQLAENALIRDEVLRLNRLLSLFIPIAPDDIPPTSLLREFIGGSSFKY